MAPLQTLPAFSGDEYIKAHLLLASRVATMMGRKFEEGDWASVYCGAKGIPESGWSNLNIDIMHGNLGVEHKMLCVRSNQTIDEHCGTTPMHPSATRSIRIPDIKDATKAAKDVLRQYAELINARKAKVRENCPDKEPDMRTGWLLWQDSLREFLYWEEAMTPPNPDDYWAEWKTSGGGNRKASKNLWVYENSTGKKRYSITTQAGAKIQPYFDVPTPKDSNLYRFIVQGEILPNGNVRVWITKSTALFLTKLLGDTKSETIAAALNKFSGDMDPKLSGEIPKIEAAIPIELPANAYYKLSASFNGVSDEHRFQQLVQALIK
jgi:hypothetical protein